MKGSLFSLGAAAVGFVISTNVAVAQTKQRGADTEASFVSAHATDVTWSPDGRYLGYENVVQGKPSEVGLYDLREGHGKVVLNLTATQKLGRLIWLSADDVELALVSDPIQQNGKAGIREAVYVIYANNQTARRVWTADVEKDQDPRFSIEVSPSLSHAIITARTNNLQADGKRVPVSTYFVITLGAGDMVVSTDVRDAIMSGHGFAGWTVNGTAFFGGGATDDLNENQLAEVTYALAITGSGTGSGSAGGGAQIQIASETLARTATLVADDIALSVFFAKTKPNIPTGTAGYELMPDAAVLRPVEFPGYWVEQDKPPVPTALAARDQSLSFKDSSGGIHSLWLTPNVKAPTKATLVSPQAEQAWLHPNGHTVAFIMNGVLFVRTVGDPI